MILPHSGTWLRPHPRVALSLLLVLACSRSPGPLPQRRPVVAPTGTAARPIPRLGYSLQAGAFAKVENAARLSGKLQAQGLEATYYASGDGLYRVRFGDFLTRDKARSEGESLKQAGTLESYWVVAPDGSAPGAGGLAHIHPKDIGGLRASLVDTARGYLGVPYLFGGTTERGFDCSGLTSAVYQLNGLRLPRSSQAQFEAGSPVELDRARAGDLVFFATSGGSRVSHVGLYLGQGAFLHAPRPGQGIREDVLADHYYQKALVGVRSYF